MALRHGFGLCLPSNPGGFAAAVNTGAAGSWTPEAFIEGGAAGDWYIGYDVTNKWIESTGVTAVAAGEDPIGKWSPEMGSGDFLQADSVIKPFWDSGQAAVRFPNQPGGGNPYNLARTGMNIAHTSAVTMMMTVWAPLANAGGGGVGRQTIRAYSTPDYGEAGRQIFITPHAFADRSVAGFGNELQTFTSPELAATQSTLSVTRTAAGKLVDFYVNGVLQAAGPSATNVYPAPLVAMVIFSSQGVGGGAMYVKDLIIATKAATAADHKGYAAYGAAL